MATEILRQPIYDTQSISAGAVAVGTQYNLFSVPVGSSSKTLLDTNMTVAGQLPYSEASIHGIRIHVYTRGSAGIGVNNYNQILNNCTMSFKKEDRTILEVPLYMIPSGYGLTGGVITTESTTTIEAVSNGVPSKSQFFDLLVPEKFKSRDRLQVNVDVKAAFTTETVTTYLVVVLEAQITKEYY